MIIKNKANNGVITLALKDYNELNEKELEVLAIPVGEESSDYADFYVSQNKDQSNMRVWGHEFSEAKKAEIEHREKYEVNLIDNLQVKLAHGNSKNAKAAKKRIQKVMENREELK